MLNEVNVKNVPIFAEALALVFILFPRYSYLKLEM